MDLIDSDSWCIRLDSPSHDGLALKLDRYCEGVSDTFKITRRYVTPAVSLYHPGGDKFYVSLDGGRFLVEFDAMGTSNYFSGRRDIILFVSGYPHEFSASASASAADPQKYVSQNEHAVGRFWLTRQEQ